MTTAAELRSALGPFADTYTDAELALGAGVLDDLKAYLDDSADQWSDLDLVAVLSAELADQAARVRVTAASTAPLREALMRRCARNLAMRKAPLGIASAGDGLDTARVGGRDPEVRRLEGPWRRLPVG